MKYTDENRGVIQNRSQGKQINNLSKLRFNNATPTDLDAFLDYKNEKFIFVEVKYKGKSLPYGQKLALERLCDSCNKDSILLIGDHLTLTGDIDVGNCKLRNYRYKNKWHIPKKPLTITEAVNGFLNF